MLTYEFCVEENSESAATSRSERRAHESSWKPKTFKTPDLSNWKSTQTQIANNTVTENSTYMAIEVAKISLEKSFTPSSAKFNKPNPVAFMGAWRCCVAANSARSTDEEIPEIRRKSKSLKVARHLSQQRWRDKRKSATIGRNSGELASATSDDAKLSQPNSVLGVRFKSRIRRLYQLHPIRGKLEIHLGGPYSLSVTPSYWCVFS